MAWWDDILGMLKDELSAAAQPPAHDAPDPVRHAQNLLRRTTRELATARAQVDALSRRLARVQDGLDTLARAQADPRYRARFAALTRSIAAENELAGGFASHIAQLDGMHDRIERQLREFEHDVAMARNARAASETTKAAAGQRPRTGRGAGEPGFRRARPKAVIDRLKDLPDAPRARKKKRRDED